MKSRSRQGRVESGNHKRRIRRSTDLAKYPGFDWTPKYFTYTCLSYEIRLRFCQQSGNWTCKCLELGAQIEIVHQPPEDIENAIHNWIAELTEALTDSWMVQGLPNTRGPLEEIDFDTWMTRLQNIVLERIVLV